VNKNHLIYLLQLLNLGLHKSEPAEVPGGLLHKMWRIETSQGIYAIKELSRDIDLAKLEIIDNYNLTEKIASRFIEKGIPAICALSHNKQYLQIIDDTGYLIYPWVDAKAKLEVSENHAIKIAKTLAKIHQIDLDIPELDQPVFDIHSNDKIRALIGKTNDLQNNLDLLLQINDEYKAAVTVLKSQSVVSHADLDPKNVLWNENDDPILIDWEAARKINPTYEIINAALDWSGISNKFDINIFNHMLAAYRSAGGIIDDHLLNSAFYGALGNWINWLVYNIKRSLDDNNIDQHKLGTEQIHVALCTILNIHKIIPGELR